MVGDVLGCLGCIDWRRLAVKNVVSIGGVIGAAPCSAAGKSNRTAIITGLTKTGGIITAAGVIMTIAFSGLLFSSTPMLNMLACYLVRGGVWDVQGNRVWDVQGYRMWRCGVPLVRLRPALVPRGV